MTTCMYIHTHTHTHTHAHAYIQPSGLCLTPKTAMDPRQWSAPLYAWLIALAQQGTIHKHMLCIQMYANKMHVSNAYWKCDTLIRFFFFVCVKVHMFTYGTRKDGKMSHDPTTLCARVALDLSRTSRFPFHLTSTTSMHHCKPVLWLTVSLCFVSL